MKKSVKVLLILVCMIFIGVFAFSGYKLYTIVHDYKVSEKMYNGLSGQYVSATGGTGSTGRKTTAPGQTESGEPGEAETSPITVDFETLLGECEDVRGWIYSEGTVINYPVVKGEDNIFYLHRFIDGEYNPGGTPFIEYLCNGDFSGKNTVVYGHHMNDGSMFASLSEYRKEGYYDEHPVMYLNTPSQNYRVDVFAGYVTDADSDTYTIGFQSEESYEEFLEKMQSQSDFKTGVKLSTEDKIITLSTCSYEFYDARYVIQGKLVPIN